MTPRTGVRASLREKEAWGLAALVVAFFHRPLLFETFFFRDLYLLFLPKRLFLASSIAAGELPLWDPTTHGGTSFLTPSNFPFHPSTLLYLVLPPVDAFNVVLVLHYVLAALGGYVLGRHFGLSRTASFLTGAAFALSGFALSTANLTPALLALPWFPIATLAWSRYLGSGGRRPLAATALALALPILGAAAETTGLVVVLLVAVSLAAPEAAGKRLRSLGALGLAVSLAAALAAVQLAPAVGIVRGSSRAEKRSWEAFTEWSVHPKRLAELAIPGLLGPVDTIDDADYVGRELEDQGFPYILGLHLGAVVLGAAAFGARKGGPLRPTVARALVALAVAGAVLSLGRYLPGFRLVWHLPLVATFRYPVKALLVSLLPVALLAGAGLDAAAAGGGRRLARLLAILAGGVALAGLAVAAGPAAGVDLASAYFGVPLGPEARVRLLASLALPLATLACGAAAVAFLPPAAGVKILAAAAVVELLLAGARVNAFAPRAIFDEPPVVARVRDVAGDGRLFRDAVAGGKDVLAPANDVAWLVRARIETLHSYSASLFGIPVVFHEDYDGLAPRRIAWLTDRLLRSGWDARVPILRSGGVRAVLTTAEPSVEGLELRAVLRSSLSPSPLRLYAVEGTSWVRFATVAERAASDEEALQRLRARRVSDGSVVLGPEGPLPASPAGTPTACSGARVTVTSRKASRSRVEVDAPCAGWLVYAEPRAPGWRTTLDGSPVADVPADVAFAAVAVPPGRHAVERVYAPRSLKGGATLSATALLAVLGLLLTGHGPRR